MLYLASALSALILLLIALKLSQRLTLRLKVLAGVTVTRQPQKSCPHLGMASDPFSHGNGPADDHRCYLYMQRDRIDLLHQKSFCLSTAHHKCPWLMIRRPDAPPPLSQRLRGAFAGGPRQAWGLAYASIRRAPALAVTTGKLFWGGIGHAANGMDGIITNLAAAIRHVGGDLAHVLDAVVGRLARALHAVGSAVWALTQRSNVAVALLARGVSLMVRGLWWLVRVPIRILAVAAGAARHGITTLASGFRARREQAIAAAASTTAPSMVAEPAAPIDHALLAELFPGLAGGEQDLRAAVPPALEPEPAFEPEPVFEPHLPPVFEPVAEPAFASASAAAEVDHVITERLEAPLSRFEELVGRLETLLSDGVQALDSGQESLAYQLFLKATEQPVKLAEQAGPELRTQHDSLMTRAWFWRAKTAETVEEVVETLEQALRYEPENLQVQAHLAWARQRLEREHHVQVGTAAALQAAPPEPATAPRRTSALFNALGVSIRVVGGLMALLLAALWMTTGVLPALGGYLTQLPAADELILRRLMLTINATALPGQGHLPLPVLHYDLGLSLPFVMAFLFVFTARGLLDGDSWARTGGLFLAALGGWLCVSAVSNPDAGRLGLALCLGIIVAAVVGRFERPKALSAADYGY